MRAVHAAASPTAIPACTSAANASVYLGGGGRGALRQASHAPHSCALLAHAFFCFFFSTQKQNKNPRKNNKKNKNAGNQDTRAAIGCAQ